MGSGKQLCFLAAAFAAVLPGVFSAGQAPASSGGAWSSNLVIPQVRCYASPSSAKAASVEIAGVSAHVNIRDQVAETRLEIQLRNASSQRQEAELLVPVPDGAVIKSFDYQGKGAEPTARLLPKDEARRTYDTVVAQSRDPALLEFASYRLVRTSVFPVEPQGTQSVRLAYEHVLPADGDRVDYVLPRTESVEYAVPWTIHASIHSTIPISAVYSPSHKVAATRPTAGSARVDLAKDYAAVPGPFRVSYLRKSEGVSASLIAYSDAKIGGGYFLLLAGVPTPNPADVAKGIKRELTLVIDRSGSMRGEKIDQAREAAIQILNALGDGESFNIFTYNETVEPFSREPVARSKESLRDAERFLKGMTAQGGTNIHDALVEALRQPVKEGVLPIVLFMTDGLATVGQTAESVIRQAAKTTNTAQRRIFTFGVGVDVNTPLLEKVASESRATATFILPGENVETKVAGVFKRLSGPVLADPVLTIGAGCRGVVTIRETFPQRLTDLFEGDQILVLGQYSGGGAVNCTLTGNFAGKQQTYAFSLSVENASTRNAFVPRLWASRKIGMLVDAIREQGGDASPGNAAAASANPRTKELVDEIVRLSTAFGILTEYTSFLAREGTDLRKNEAVVAEATKNFTVRAIQTRTGLASVNQELNNHEMKWQGCTNPLNRFVCPDGTIASTAAIQQVCDLTYYKRNERWVDSRLVAKGGDVTPAKTIAFDSAEFKELAARMADQGRPGGIALRGDILMLVDDQPVLIKAAEIDPKRSE